MPEWVWSYAVPQLEMTALVFFIGRGLLRVIGRGSVARRTHGEYVFWWSWLAYGAGGIAGAWLGDTPGGKSGLAWFCLLAGWLVGTLHGAAVLVGRQFRRPHERPRQAGETPG